MAIRLLGPSNYYVHNLNPVVNVNGPWTIAAHIVVNAVSAGSGNWAELINIAPDPDGISFNGLHVVCDSDRLVRVSIWNSGSFVDEITTGPLSLGVRYCVTVSRDSGGTVRLYLDGALAATSSTTWTFTDTLPFLVSQTEYTGFEHTIEYLRIWNAQLTGPLLAAAQRVNDLKNKSVALLHDIPFWPFYRNPNGNGRGDLASNATEYWSSTQGVLQNVIPQYVYTDQNSRHSRILRKTKGPANPVRTSYGATNTRGSATLTATYPVSSVAATSSTASTTITAQSGAVASTAAASTTATAAVGVGRAVANSADTTTSASTSIGVGRAVANSADTTTSASTSIGVGRAVANSADTTTSASTSIGVGRAVASTAVSSTAAATAVGASAPIQSAGNVTTAASASVGASSAVASTAGTTTTAAASASNGVQASGAVTTTATVTLLVTLPVVSTGDTTSSSIARLVAPISSTAVVTTAASAAVSAAAAVSSTAVVSSSASAAVAQASAVASTAVTTTTASTAATREFSVSSTAVTTTGASSAIQSARSITSTADVRSDSFAGVGVLVVKPITTAYTGAANSFTGAPDARIFVGITAPPTGRKREWPYHPRT